MASDIEFLKQSSVKFLGKDFSSLKRDLMRFADAHHSGVFVDKNESSPGMALLEYAAYAGNVLGFYLDMSFNELRQDTATQIENVVAFAKSLGYRPQGKRAARGKETFYIEVPSTLQGSAYVPDDLYSPVLLRGAKVDGPNGTVFETVDDLDFSVDNAVSPRFVTGSQFDPTSGQPTHFVIKKSVDILAGETKTATFSVGSFRQFLSLELPDEDVLEVLTCVDSDGNDWFEVDFLPQEVIFDQEVNQSDDSDVVPYVLKLKTVPRRFVVDRDPVSNKTSVVFGSGEGASFDDQLVPNLADMALPLAGKRTFGSFSIDPQNFLKTRSLGLSPFNTTLTFTYRVGGGSQTNVPAGSIKSVRQADMSFSTTGLDPSKKSNVVNSIQATNVVPTVDGGPEESVSEVKANAGAFFAAQNRVVTKADVVARVMSLPARFGKPAKVFARRGAKGRNSVDVHVLSLDADGHLVQSSPTLFQNLSTYLGRYRMITTGINFLQTDIIGLRVEFGVVVAPGLNKTEVLSKCLSVVGDYFDVDKMQIGAPIVISDLSSVIQSVLGVISVYRLELKNTFRRGGDCDCPTTSFDVAGNIRSSILYCPPNSIFEVRDLRNDVLGEAR